MADWRAGILIVVDNPIWMTADDPLWIAPLVAQAQIEKVVGSASEARSSLLDALKGGAVVSSGIVPRETTPPNARPPLGLTEDELVRRIIPSGFWAEASKDDERAWSWRSGTFKCSFADITEYLDVGIARVDVRGLCEELRSEREGSTGCGKSSETPRRTEADNIAVPKGGRNSEKHGEPIAKLAIQLFTNEDELARYTGAALEPELEQAYRDCGVNPPSAGNLKGISLGILRAVRSARGLRG